MPCWWWCMWRGYAAYERGVWGVAMSIDRSEAESIARSAVDDERYERERAVDGLRTDLNYNMRRLRDELRTELLLEIERLDDRVGELEAPR